MKKRKFVQKYMKPKKYKKYNKQIWGFSCESKNDTFLRCCFYNSEKNYFVFNDQEEAIKFLSSKKLINAEIIGTDIQEDLFLLLKGTKHNDDIYFFIPDGRFIYAKTYITKIGINKTRIKNMKNRIIYFKETRNFLEEKNTQLAERMKTEDKNNIGICFIDAKTSCLFAKEYIKLFGVFKYTAGGNSMEIFRTKYQKKDMVVLSDNEIEEYKKSYYGGKTEVYKRGKIENMYLYDINSSFGYAMTFKFPDFHSLRVRYGNNIKNIMDHEGKSIVEIIVPDDLEFPLLPVKYKDKIRCVEGRYIGEYTHILLREAIKRGYKILRVFKSYIFLNTEYTLKDFANNIYNLRKKLKEQKHPLADCVKPILVTLYGKFSQMFENQTEIFAKQNATIEQANNGYFEISGDFCRIIKKPKKKYPNYCNPLIASYITDRARIQLQYLLEEYEGIYCDCDSIITKKKIPTSQDMGGLKLEFIIDYGIIIKPKMYRLWGTDCKTGNKSDKLVIKGLPEDIRDRHLIACFDDLIKNGDFRKFIYTINRTIKLKESFQRHILYGTPIKEQKSIQFLDDKRKWKNKYFNSMILESSKPICINDKSNLELESYIIPINEVEHGK